MMTLNAETKKQWWLWIPKLRSDNDSKRRNREAMVALNTETENDDGSEHQKWKAMVALNAETKNDDGTKRRNWEAMKALNAKNEKWW